MGAHQLTELAPLTWKTTTIVAGTAMAGSPALWRYEAGIERMHMSDVTICMADGNVTHQRRRCPTILNACTETVGRAHPHVEIRIADPETGATIERGETGEFCTEDTR